ncbi:MAG: cupin domain-containing protein [Betaproteobacteria bacterium]|nr:cupin domain-containing protein [Betaproteobacteria bacterium]
MNVTEPLTLLGGISPERFMKQYWHKKPLLVRQAMPQMKPVLGRAELFELAAQDEVQSRLVIQDGDSWRLKHGPFQRRALPPLKRPGWTLLVQGVDLHQELAHALVQAFRFVPDCRLDDLMISYATDGGGVGPHFDSYDVFLLQVQGRRRWRIGRQKDLSLQAGVPLKILADFAPEQEFLLEAGDMLYLPPRYAHDGLAVGECMTCSIGFRAPQQGELAREMLQRLADDAPDLLGDSLYRDPHQPATLSPAEIPTAVQNFAREAILRVLQDPLALARTLGELLTEPKSEVWFERPGLADTTQPGALRLDRRTKMMFDDKHVFINGEAFRAGGKDATLIRLLADQRRLNAAQVGALSVAAQALLRQWIEAGWVHGN